MALLENCTTAPNSLGLKPEEKAAMCAEFCTRFAASWDCPLETLDERQRTMRPEESLADAVKRVLEAQEGSM